MGWDGQLCSVGRDGGGAAGRARACCCVILSRDPSHCGCQGNLLTAPHCRGRNFSRCAPLLPHGSSGPVYALESGLGWEIPISSAVSDAKCMKRLVCGLLCGLVLTVRAEEPCAHWQHWSASDIRGSDLHQADSSTLDACKAACLRISECRAFTWPGSQPWIAVPSSVSYY